MVYPSAAALHPEAQGPIPRGDHLMVCNIRVQLVRTPGPDIQVVARKHRRGRSRYYIMYVLAQTHLKCV
jgi:hypothetical protein